MLAEIRKAIADQLNAELGSSMQVSPHMLGNPTVPSAHVYPMPVEYDDAFQRGMDTWTFALELFVGNVNSEAAQLELDTYIEPTGARSVKRILEEQDATGNATLGGLVFDISVTSCSGYQRFLIEGRGPVIGTAFQIEVKADGG